MYLHVSFKRALLREPFSTLFTLERPFSGMNSNMHLQLVSVAKRVLTNLTLKRFATLFGLSKIGGEFSFAVVAERLQDVRVIGMHQIVRLQVPLSNESPTTDVTLERLLCSMAQHMYIQMRLRLTIELACGTRIFTGVYAQMSQHKPPGKMLSAILARLHGAFPFMIQNVGV